MVKTKSCVCVFGQVVVLRWDQRFSQFLRYPTGLFRPRKQRAVEADLLWRIGGRDRTGTMRLADCCVQGRPRSEGYRWVRRATKRTRRLAKSSRFGTRTGSIQEQTGTDRIGHSSGGGGSVVPRPTYTSGQPHAGTWQAEQKHQAWWCREGSCTSSAYRLSRWPGEPQPGFIMPAGRSPSAMARIREPWGLFSPIEGHGGALPSPGPGMDSWGAVMDSSHGVRMEGAIGTS